MIDEGMGSCILHQMYQNWIIPELEARVGANTLPPDFQIKRCLIRLPKNAPPIVQFNEETTLTARVKVPIDRDVKIGDDAWLEDIEYLERVQPPELNGVRVAFFYAHWVNGRYSVFCDLRPNSNDLPEDAANWSFGESIAKALQASVVELALAVHDSVKTELMKVGLWAAPALLPYPLSKIARLVKDGNETEARQVFVEHCSAKRLTDLVSGW